MSRRLTLERINTDDPDLRILLACQLIRRELRAIRRSLGLPQRSAEPADTDTDTDTTEGV